MCLCDVSVFVSIFWCAVSLACMLRFFFFSSSASKHECMALAPSLALCFLCPRVCVCVCVCLRLEERTSVVNERERQFVRDIQGETDRVLKFLWGFVCVCTRVNC